METVESTATVGSEENNNLTPAPEESSSDAMVSELNGTKMSVDNPATMYFEEMDLAYEEDILRNPFSTKSWLRYIEHKKRSPHMAAVNLIYERSLKELPGSYKLWYNYLKLRRSQVKGKIITDPGYESVNNAFERALVFMHKMPRIWLDYCKFLMDQCRITRTRKTFDRALRALPITQHHRIWTLYLKFARSHDLPETAIRIYRRHLKLQPENTEEFVSFLIEKDRLDEAAIRLTGIINDDGFVSKEGKSKHQLWNELCELISKNPDKVKSLKVEPIIRQGIKRYTDQIGLLWNSLADYYIRSGLFERARDIYEEAIRTVLTVRDFTQVFDAYAAFEDTMISARMEKIAEKAKMKEELMEKKKKKASKKKQKSSKRSDEITDDNVEDLGKTESSIEGFENEDDLELEMRLTRYEDLLDRRPLLLNSVLLRQNPHNVHEWHKRVELYSGQPVNVINTYTEAVQTVDPLLATGRPHTLWVEFAKYYEKADQREDARIVFERAVKVGFKNVDDLASVWCEWAEMELRHDDGDAALKLMQRATALPTRKVDYHDSNESVQDRLHKSLKVWSLYADLEESFGTFQTCKAVYDQIISLRIATPQIIMNYGMFLEENNYFEEAFKAYEKGVALFKWPNVYDIWNTYLTKFIERYGGKKLERARDLFEQCLESCPEEYSKTLYLLYAKLEENYGLARHAMAVYERATKAVPSVEQYDLFIIYIKRAKELFGVTYTRPIFEKAIEALPDQQAISICMQFADMERKLGEIDRARAIYSHCSQMCDPRVASDFWATWKQFEIKHGNEDTLREMLRIKRSVQAVFNTQVDFMSAQMLAAASKKTPVSGSVPTQSSGLEENTQDSEKNANTSMNSLESKARALAEQAVLGGKDGGGGGGGDDAVVGKTGAISFVRSKDALQDDTKEENDSARKMVVVDSKNPDEIDLDEEDEDMEDVGNEQSDELIVKKRGIPTEVFSGLLEDKDDTEFTSIEKTF